MSATVHPIRGRVTRTSENGTGRAATPADYALAERLELHARAMRALRDDLFDQLRTAVETGDMLAQRAAAHQLARHLDAIIAERLLELAGKDRGPAA